MVYFAEGGSEDMGIFAGYGAGWYFKMGVYEFGPYDTQDEAIGAQEEREAMEYGAPEA